MLIRFKDERRSMSSAWYQVSEFEDQFAYHASCPTEEDLRKWRNDSSGLEEADIAGVYGIISESVESYVPLPNPTFTVTMTESQAHLLHELLDQHVDYRVAKQIGILGKLPVSNFSRLHSGPSLPSLIGSD